MAITDVLGGAITVGRSLIRPTRAVDVVAITGAGFAPLFSAARPMTAEVHERSSLMEHPLETGAVIADHIVRDPIEIELPVIIVGEANYRNTYALIRATYMAGTLLTVVTRTGSYPNMVLTEIPHEETSGAFDAVGMRIVLREANFVTPKNGSLSQSETKNASQSSTVGRGAQQTTAANASQSAKAGAAYGASGAGSGIGPQGSTLHQWFGGT